MDKAAAGPEHTPGALAARGGDLARRNKELAALLRATRSVMADLDLRGIFDRILAEAAQISGCAHVKVLVLDREAAVLRVAAVRGTAMSPGFALPVGVGLSGLVAQTGEPVVSLDTCRDPRNALFAERDRELGIVTYLGLPIKIRDEVAGVLAFNTTAPHEFSPEEQAYLAVFADQAAIAIENARLHDAAVRRSQQFALLTRVTQSLVASMHPEAVGQEVMRAVQALMPQAAARLWDLKGEDAAALELVASIGLQDARGGTVRFRKGEGMAGVAAATRRPVVSRDVLQDPRFVNKSWAAQEKLVSAILFPLLAGDRIHGILAIFTREPHDFPEEEVSLLQSLAAHAAIALENARLYEAVRQNAFELERRVRQRTAELEEALRVKVDFLSKMSHELRTPLNFILGFSELLQQGVGGPLTPKQATYVERISGGGKRLLGLFNDILDIAQVDAGKGRLNLEPVIVGPLVQEALGLVLVQASQKGLKLATALDPWVPFIVADRFKLSQVLHNLVGNAVKFTPGGGLITVRTRTVMAEEGGSRGAEGPARPPGPPAPRECVEIVVEDTGIGIRPENLEAIFSAFYQVDGSDTRAHGGAGLGLTLVRKLVELHGGRVWAESAGLGQGARFIVRLPRLEVPKAKKILLVEDEALIRIQMASALESAGFAVIHAATGSEALTEMEAMSPDLMILDVILPDMEGWEVLRRIRAGEEIRTLPVLVVSGLESVNLDVAVSRGADEFLTKPVSPRVLVDTVLRLLAQAAASADMAEGPTTAPGRPPGITQDE